MLNRNALLLLKRKMFCTLIFHIELLSRTLDYSGNSLTLSTMMIKSQVPNNHRKMASLQQFKTFALKRLTSSKCLQRLKFFTRLQLFCSFEALKNISTCKRFSKFEMFKSIKKFETFKILNSLKRLTDLNSFKHHKSLQYSRVCNV